MLLLLLLLLLLFRLNISEWTTVEARKQERERDLERQVVWHEGICIYREACGRSISAGQQVFLAVCFRESVNRQLSKCINTSCVSIGLETCATWPWEIYVSASVQWAEHHGPPWPPQQCGWPQITQWYISALMTREKLNEVGGCLESMCVVWRFQRGSKQRLFKASRIDIAENQRRARFSLDFSV